MKFWRSAAALLTIFHPETTHTGNHFTPKDVKNDDRSGKVYENKGAMDKMSEIISDICARLEPFLQKIGVNSASKCANCIRRCAEWPHGGRRLAGVPHVQRCQAEPTALPGTSNFGL